MKDYINNTSMTKETKVKLMVTDLVKTIEILETSANYNEQYLTTEEMKNIREVTKLLSYWLFILGGNNK